MNQTQEPQQWEDLVIREPEAKATPAPARVPAPKTALPLAPFAVKPAARSSHQLGQTPIALA